MRSGCGMAATRPACGGPPHPCLAYEDPYASADRTAPFKHATTGWPAGERTEGFFLVQHDSTADPSEVAVPRTRDPARPPWVR